MVYPRSWAESPCVLGFPVPRAVATILVATMVAKNESDAMHVSRVAHHEVQRKIFLNVFGLGAGQAARGNARLALALTLCLLS